MPDRFDIGRIRRKLNVFIELLYALRRVVKVKRQYDSEFSVRIREIRIYLDRLPVFVNCLIELSYTPIGGPHVDDGKLFTEEINLVPCESKNFRSSPACVHGKDDNFP